MLIIILPQVGNSEKLEKSSGATMNHLNSRVANIYRAQTGFILPAITK
jgi:hypothetical protein